MIKKIAEVFYDYEYRKIMRLFVKGFITEKECTKRMRFWSKVFYPKWVLGECHHICAFCEYKSECFGNIE